ncbi:restriction endonuclease subunit S [Aeromonas veronii]|uniref:restriction endonuclease subunit S n=1 Tax=Aeromonas veronii TaxID=654 RepID=UPI0014300668|nr:restriction endonuclease subunit S [Aeromonas veronii]NJI23191.1 restriction endonuclease subunit S [Aeromonas veronii]NJI33188.1 restriction endonuclease subunit S [Aeromonas veronii]
MAIENLITDHLDLWTAAVRPKSSAGRGTSSKLELTGIKKLRELILELAVRGKLVPQDPSDEPASVLLERIAAEKAQLIREGKIKSEKQYPVISDTELPHSKPDGWVFERFGNVLINRDFERIPLAVSEREKRKGGYDYYGASGVIDKIDGYLFDKPLLLIGEDGANLINRSSPIAFIARGKYWVNNHAHVLDGLNEDLLKYVCLHINAMSLLPYITGTAQPKMNQAKMNAIVLGIPPLAEQKRIVAKVDELMALCDQLELCSESQLAAHQTLVETLLVTLTDSCDADELAQNWARLSTHFDILFTTEASIDALKQTILQLAVMGKLVPQDPSDEPASTLLARITAEKTQLIKEKKIKKEKPLPAISEEEKPFELPQGWVWCRLNDLALSSEAGWSPQCEPTSRECNKWGVLKVSAVTWGIFKPEENKELPESLEPRPEYEVKPGDFLISRANTAELVARAVIVPHDAPIHLMMSDKLIRFKFSKLVEPHFVNMVNNSVFSRTYYAKVAGGTSSSMKNVSRRQIQNLVVALPPRSEELKIIDKVNGLMTICDRLKSRLQTSQQTQLALAESLVEGALA